MLMLMRILILLLVLLHLVKAFSVEDCGFLKSDKKECDCLNGSLLNMSLASENLKTVTLSVVLFQEGKKEVFDTCFSL